MRRRTAARCEARGQRRSPPPLTRTRRCPGPCRPRYQSASYPRLRALPETIYSLLSPPECYRYNIVAPTERATHSVSIVLVESGRLRTIESGLRRGEMRLTRLRELRERAFLTQRELAAKSGIAHATVNRIELGRQEARIGTGRKLARGLGVEP